MTKRKRNPTPMKPDDPRHGTANGYGNLLCRCPRCTDAHRIRCAEHRKHRGEILGPCTNCKEKPQYAKGQCNRCREYKRRTGRDWKAQGLWQRKKAA